VLKRLRDPFSFFKDWDKQRRVFYLLIQWAQKLILNIYV
jgi:hypothetical protein